MKLLDLFCGAGGAAMGYSRAGFEVVGVDSHPMPRYPFEFHQADALAFVAEHGHEFDCIHASPPCQRYSRTINLTHNAHSHPDLIADVRTLLRATKKLYVIENVEGAPLDGITLCGLVFGLKVYRHRVFESNVLLLQPAHVQHRDSMPAFGHGLSPKGFVSVAGGSHFRGESAYRRFAMGIDWMATRELQQAIPPVYTLFVGAQLMRALQYQEVASNQTTG
jgi:DNA (cytosine-5)-methyltransferase 1